MTAEFIKKISPSLVNRVPSLAGPFGQYSTELENIVYTPPDYEKYQKRVIFNPDPDIILEELLNVLKERNGNISASNSVPPMRKRDVFDYFVAFSDQHTKQLRQELYPKEGCTNFILGVLEESRKSRKTLTCSEQLSCAMDITQNDLASAIIVLATGTRVAARNFDSNGGIVVSEGIMEEWKTAVSPFGFNGEGVGDPAGDTYHFWNGVLVGMSVRARRESNLYEKITGGILEKLYDNTAKFTELLRHKISGHDGKLHDGIDCLGLAIGQALFYPETLDIL